MMAFSSFGQGFYINVGAGYGFSNAAGSIGSDYTHSETGLTPRNTGESYTLVKGSFGAGLNLGLSAGYAFNEHVSAELGFSMLMGSSYDVTSTFTYSFDTTMVGAFSHHESSVDKTTYKGSMIRITPSIKITGGDADASIRPYARIGIVLGLSGKVTATSTGNSSFSETLMTSETHVSEGTEEYTGGMATGLSGSLGVLYKLSETMALYGEINMVGQSWAPTTGTITKSTYDGVDELATMKTNQKSFTYSDTYSVPTSINEGSPSPGLKTYVPFSSFGIAIGLHMSFGSK